MSLAVFQSIGVTELLIVLGIVLVIFGPKRLPMLGRQIGAGFREFRASVARKADKDDEDEDGDTAALGAGEQQHRPPPPTASPRPPPASARRQRSGGGRWPRPCGRSHTRIG